MSAMIKKGSKRQRTSTPVAKRQLFSLSKRVSALTKASKADLHMATFAANGVSLATAGAVDYLTPIAQGDDNNSRTGNGIAMQKATMRLHFIQTSAATEGITCRVLLVQDSMTNGAAPAVTDVLTSATVWGTHHINNQLQHRFKFLREKIFTIGTALTDTNRIDFTWKIKGKEFNKVNYIGTTAAITSAGKGALYVVYLVSGLASGTPTISYGIEYAYMP